jgi:hypothetical protein
MNEVVKDIENSDVVIVGGGPSGFGAAVAASRMGLSVYLLESGYMLGGIMARCPGMPIGAVYPKGKSIGGILDEFLNRLYAMNPPAAEKRKCRLSEFGPEVFYNHEIATYTLFQMAEEAGVNLLLDATVTEPILDNSRLSGVFYYDKNGKHAVYAKVIIDCSGDGYIAAKANVPFDKGDEATGQMMGASLTFFMVNVEADKIEEYDDHYFTKYAEKGIKSGQLHEDLHRIYWFPGFHKNTIFFNSVHIRGVDGTKSSDVTKASIEARKRVRQLAEFFKEEIHGFEKSHVETIGPAVGIRETRRFEGLYKLSKEDIFTGKKFSDGVVCCDNAVDNVYRSTNTSIHTSLIEKGVYYQVPYRCMVPKSIENLLFAGRCISADSVALASMRGMSTCMGLGQAAGIAAGMAIINQERVQGIDYHELVKELQKQGVNGLGEEEL